MGNAHGHHGDQQRKQGGYTGGHDGLTFADKVHGREISPFDPVSISRTKTRFLSVCMYTIYIMNDVLHFVHR